MQCSPSRCPSCNGTARGTIEVIEGLAEMNFDEDSETYEYGGSTDMHWDSQMTVVEGGKPTGIDDLFEVIEGGGCSAKRVLGEAGELFVFVPLAKLRPRNPGWRPITDAQITQSACDCAGGPKLFEAIEDLPHDGGSFFVNFEHPGFRTFDR